MGISAVRLSNGKKIQTPWGTLLPSATEDTEARFLHGPKGTAVLVERRLMTVKFDAAPTPRYEFDAAEVDTQRARTLLPVAVALAQQIVKLVFQ